MANIPAALKDWSATAASNQPDTSDSNTIVADLQQIQATVRGHLASRATIASGSTVDLSTITGVIASVTHSSGTTAISSFGTLSAGIWKIVTFAITGGTLTLTHHATQLIIPGSANLTLVSGDSLIAESLGSGNWKVHVVQRVGGVSAATQAQQETATSNAVAVTPGVQQYHPTAAKAWANWASDGSLNTSHNVSSVTDSGAGDFTVNFTVAFSGANYTVAAVAADTNPPVITGFGTLAAGAADINTRVAGGTLTDSAGGYCAAFYGDQ
jgi:hypothetical protein